MKRNFTKIILVSLAAFLIGSVANAQNSTGLQNIIVEKYYVSNEADAAASIGTLPIGSVTYRIFVDMKQGYTFQAAYGNSILGVPFHTLKINTTTSFFNNEDRGATSPTYSKAQAAANTVMLDSWLSVGAGCTGQFGIPLVEDNGVATVTHPAGVLTALNANDGLIQGTPQAVTFVGPQMIDGVSVFDAISQAGKDFIITDGAWSALNGAVGPDTTNKVLIAQLTTDGDFSFELNIQLGTPTGGTEQYVAKDAVDKETMFPGLTYSSIHDGLNEIPAKDKNAMISVFPNPTTGKFSLGLKQVNNNSNSQYKIYNMLGEVVLKKYIENVSGEVVDKIDLSSYPNGIYFIEVTVDGKKVTSKLIKK
jgi:hypothetical protein